MQQASVPPVKPTSPSPATLPAGYVPTPSDSLQPETATATRTDVFTIEATPIWQSTNLSENAQSGSTLKKGGTLTIQGAGTDMWKGYDRCRLVWTPTSGNYAFSTRVRTIANNDDLAVTGLMVKGPDPAAGPGLLFGFLGNSYLFLQIRQPNKTVVVKSSGRPIHIPSYLQFIRRGKTFEAYTSIDGHSWVHFASCELDMPNDATIGFVVSPQVPDTLATATFTAIHLMTPLTFHEKNPK